MTTEQFNNLHWTTKKHSRRLGSPLSDITVRYFLPREKGTQWKDPSMSIVIRNGLWEKYYGKAEYIQVGFFENRVYFRPAKNIEEGYVIRASNTKNKDMYARISLHNEDIKLEEWVSAHQGDFTLFYDNQYKCPFITSNDLKWVSKG